MKTEQLTLERLKEVLRYEPETGCFWWNERGIPKWDGKWADRIAGAVKRHKNSPCEYIVISIDKVRYRAHRLAWFYMTGEWPKIIDHENRNGLDNRFDNLIDSSRQSNQKNLTKRKDNTSGATGVEVRKDRFIAKIQVNKKTRHLGVFKTLEEAVSARKDALELYNFHPTHGEEKC